LLGQGGYLPNAIVNITEFILIKNVFLIHIRGTINLQNSRNVVCKEKADLKVNRIREALGSETLFLYKKDPEFADAGTFRGT
jgi:hypothetical protein